MEHWDTEVASLSDQVEAKRQELVAQRQQLIAARQQQAGVEQQRAAAEATLNQAKINLQNAVGVRPTQLAQLKAQVEAAEWNVGQTAVYAPEDGYITQLQLQPGAMASIGPVMVFVYAKNRILLKTTIMQNYLNVVKPGAEAEVAVPALPGRILNARVIHIEKATGSGQLEPDGRLKTSLAPAPPDRMFVILCLESDLEDAILPVGSSGWVSIRGEEWPEMFIIRQIIMRWYAWTNYIFAGY